MFSLIIKKMLKWRIIPDNRRWMKKGIDRSKSR